MTKEELASLMAEMGEKRFRADQIFSWFHKRCASSWDEMTDLSKNLRGKLMEYPLNTPEILEVQTSKIDGTKKYLFRLFDGNVIESVFMRYHHGNSVCISSQAGCRISRPTP